MAKSNRPASAAKAGQTARPKAQNGASSGGGRPAQNTANTARTTAASATTAATTGAKSGTNQGGSRLQEMRARTGQQPAARRVTQHRKVRQPWYKGAGAIWTSVVAIGLIIAFIVLLANRSSGGLTPLPATVYNQMTSVTPETFAKVGTGGLQQPLTATPANTAVWKDSSGKPIIFYVGAEYCPFCAAERWSVVTALSRFGTFTGLKEMTSSDTDNPASVPTVSFRGATYSSPYITFTARELQDRTGQQIYSLTGEEKTVFETYDSPPYVAQSNQYGIPFISFANQYLAHNAGYTVQVLNGQTRESIAQTLSKNDPNDPITQNIIGNANYITSAICKVTDNKPANVCTAAPIPDLQKQLPARS